MSDNPEVDVTDVTIANSVRFSWSRSKEGSNGGELGGSSVVTPDPCGELDAGPDGTNVSDAT